MSHDLSFVGLTRQHPGVWPRRKDTEIPKYHKYRISSSSSYSNSEDMNLGNLPISWLNKTFPAATSDPSQSHFSRGKCVPFLSRHHCGVSHLWAKLEYDQIYMRNVLNQKNSICEWLHRKSGFEPEHHHRKKKIQTLKNTMLPKLHLWPLTIVSLCVFFSVCFHLKFFGNSFTANVVLVAKSTTKKTNIGRRRDPLLPPPLGRCTVVIVVMLVN